MYRLHALGDFPTLDYTVDIYEALAASGSAAFGYTHWQPETPIGSALQRLAGKHWQRFAIRTSYKHGTREPLTDRGAVIVANSTEAKAHDAIVCPEQTGRARNCAACGLCWNTTRNVAFLLHGSAEYTPNKNRADSR